MVSLSFPWVSSNDPAVTFQRAGNRSVLITTTSRIQPRLSCTRLGSFCSLRSLSDGESTINYLINPDISGKTENETIRTSGYRNNWFAELLDYSSMDIRTIRITRFVISEHSSLPECANLLIQVRAAQKIEGGITLNCPNIFAASIVM